MRKVLLASCAGTVIEWYDFFIFGAVAPILAQHFYPADNPTVSLIRTLATFAVGFAVRPLGALFFGRMGDRVGRKAAFLTTLILMGVSTAAIGMLPTYSKIGFLAPAALILLRLTQGFAIGGEYGGAAVYVAEHVPVDRRGFYTSFIYTTGTLGLLMSLLVLLAVRRTFGEQAFVEWSWRLPFLLSALLVGLSYYVRLQLAESPMYAQIKAARETSDTPVRDSFGGRRWRLILTLLFGVLAGHAVVWYTGQFYALFFLQTALHIPLGDAYQCMTIALILGAPFFVFFGWLSDRIGRRSIILGGIALAALLFIPIYHGMAAAADPYKPVLMTFLVFVQVVLAAMCTGPLGAFLVDAFPTKIRYTSLSFVHHTGTGWFGGFLPVIAESLVVKTENMFAGLWYPVGVAAIAAILGMLFVEDPHPYMHAEQRPEQTW
jgi:MFS family permease